MRNVFYDLVGDEYELGFFEFVLVDEGVGLHQVLAVHVHHSVQEVQDLNLESHVLQLPQLAKNLEGLALQTHHLAQRSLEDVLSYGGLRSGIPQTHKLFDAQTNAVIEAF